MSARWSEEASDAMVRAGFDVVEYAMVRAGFDVVEYDGVGDYQGWGVYLGFADGGPKRGKWAVLYWTYGSCSGCGKWAVLYWTYGSCSGCDAYEGKERDDVVNELAEIVEEFDDEAKARQRFQDTKGW